ncbi:MAG: methyl-accepting chemotaxis protein [Brevinema sp.]
MAYDNINSSISKYSHKTIAMWLLLSILTIAGGLLYFHKVTKHTLLYKNTLYFTEISSEASLLLNNDVGIDSSKTSLSSWNILHKKQFLATIPTLAVEVNYLEEVGEKFYQSLSSKNEQLKSATFQELYDQIELIKRLVNSSIRSSYIHTFTKIVLPGYVGLLFICIFVTLHGAAFLSRSIVSKNSIILENIWEELQSIDWKTPKAVDNLNKIDMNRLYPLLHYTEELFSKIEPIEDGISSYIEQAKTTSVSISSTPVTKDPENPELKDKIVIMQKMLSRLFTRAERASTLAKSSSDNGFQAGILALNISIEASKAGESGKPFMAVSDRVKSFAEKSSNIGQAIIKELQDADLVIRKSYAVAKNILEGMPESQNTSPTVPQKAIPSLDFSALNHSKEQLADIKELCSQLKAQSEFLEEHLVEYVNKDSGEASISDSKILLVREGLLRNFEQLYRHTYGIDPVMSQTITPEE